MYTLNKMASNKMMNGVWATGKSNIFYFASLKELQYKVYECPADPNIPNHPVLQTCRKLFHEEKLVTWNLGRNGLQLWVFFWPTENHQQWVPLDILKEVESGRWDNGLPSECLSHLYKAVYQHFERSLFKDGYARIGKYFVKADGTAQRSFQIGFFIHGEDSLCASIEPRDKLQAHFLRKNNLDCNQKLKVVLMPIGVECTLTGTFLNLINSPQTLQEVENLYPAYEIDRGNPVLCQRLFLVETVISGYTMLYPASHVLIVNTVTPSPRVKSTLLSLNDELAGIISSEGQVTSASSTQVIRDPSNQQAVWKESGFWTYKPPPDNIRCEKHLTCSSSALIETSTCITKRTRAPMHRKRLQRSVYKSSLERNKYRDDRSPVIILPTLPIKSNKEDELSVRQEHCIPNKEVDVKARISLPKLHPTIRNHLLLSWSASGTTGGVGGSGDVGSSGVDNPSFDPQPLTIECVENVACHSEDAFSREEILRNKIYNLPATTNRKPLPMPAYTPQAVQRSVPETPMTVCKRQATPLAAVGHTRMSPNKRIKQEVKGPATRECSQGPLDNNVPLGAPTMAPQPHPNPTNNDNAPSRSLQSRCERQKVNFTHEADIEVDGGDLDKIFESESDTDEDYKDLPKESTSNPITAMDLDHRTSSVVVPESCLTPENVADPKCMLSPSQSLTQNLNYIAPQSHDYPTPPSNETNSYESDSEVSQHQGKSTIPENKNDSYFQKLVDLSSYSSLVLDKPSITFQSYKPLTRSKPPQGLVMINSPRKNQGGPVSRSLKDITAEIDSIATELKEVGALSTSSDYTRTVQASSVIKDEITLSAIGEQLMSNPNSSFVFTSSAQQAHVKKELSSLPKIESGKFLMKFGNSSLNRFTVNTDDVQIPGWYTCIPGGAKSVSLDIARMEIVPQADHKSTVGYHPKTSISIPLYQPFMNSHPKSQNPNCFLAVQNSRFSASFLKILQQLVRNVPSEHQHSTDQSDVMERRKCIVTVGKVLKGNLPPHLIPQSANLLLWKEFISLAGMEPYSGKKDVCYLVVAPENPHLINNIGTLLKELSAVYELCNLGHHTQLSTKIRDGILRVGKKSGEKVIGEPCDPWFVRPHDQESISWQIYAKCCHHILAKYLSTILHNIGSKDFMPIVIYIVDPFMTQCASTKAQVITRSFNAMYDELNKIPNTQFILQCLPVSYVSDMHRNTVQLNTTLTNICFSVYNQALKHTKPKPLATCLTGFGPISNEAIVLEGGDQRRMQPKNNHFINTPPLVLAPSPFKDVNQPYDTIYCAYALSHDSNWVIVTVTDATGHMTDSAIYAVDEPTRSGVVPESVINNIWSLCLSMVENFKCLWSIVISKMGSVSDFEDQVWSDMFNNIVQRNTDLQQRCSTCKTSTKIQQYGIASASLLTILNPGHISIQLPEELEGANKVTCSPSSHIINLRPQPTLAENNEHYKKIQDDNTFTFYTGPDVRDRKKKILSSAYMACSDAVTDIPRHMGPGTSNIILGNLHRHVVVPTAPKKHVLCGDSNSLVLRYVLQRYDALSWLHMHQSQRLSPLPHHMYFVSRIYASLQNMTYTPS